MRNDQADDDKTQIGHDILEYLIEHPDAQDTLEGIIEWWLLEQKIRHQTLVVREALSKLVEEGFVIEKKGQGVSPSYRINADKAHEAQELLKGPSREHMSKTDDKGT